MITAKALARQVPAWQRAQAEAITDPAELLRELALDPAQQPAAQAALRSLVATADVFMHSMRPQKLAGLGLDPETVLALTLALGVEDVDLASLEGS